MLDLMRRKKRLKAILWVVIFSLALGMLLFFVPGVDINNVATDTSAATVDGKPIPMRELVRAYRKTVDYYSKSGQNKMDSETLKALGISEKVLDGLIEAKVMESIGDRLGVKITPDEVRRAIETHPNLQIQGQFVGVDQYKAILAENNILVSEFEENVGNLELSKKIRSILTDGMEVSDQELRDEFARNNLQTQLDFVSLKTADFTKRIKPSEADLQAYFEGKKNTYKTKEKRRAQYLLAPLSQLIAAAKVTEDDILQEWNQRSHDEEVEAAHILFKIDDPAKEAETRKKAEEVLAKAKAGEDFAALAKKYSQDPGSANSGGALGSFTRSSNMVPEFKEAAFSLKPGEISNLVKSQYGFHIIKVSRHETPTLESNRSGLITAVQIQKAKEAAKQKAEEALRTLEKNKDLSLAAKNLGAGAEVKEIGLFTKEDPPFELGISPELRDDIWGLKEINSIGHVVEHPMGFAIPKLLEVQLPKPGEFNEFKSQIEKDYTEFKANELLKAEAKKLSEEAVKQGSLEKAAKGMGFTAKTSQPFKKDGVADPEIGSNSAFNETAFDLAPGAVSSPLPTADKTTVFQVKSRTPFDEAEFLKQKNTLRENLLLSLQAPYFENYVKNATEELAKAGKIRKNKNALEELDHALY